MLAPNLGLGLVLLIASRSSLLESLASMALCFFPLLCLLWNIALAGWIARKGGPAAARGARLGVLLVFLASSGCWGYTFDRMLTS